MGFDAAGDQVVSVKGTVTTSGGGGGTQYTEDVASAGAESLTLAGAVRRDTAASSSGTDGDYSTINTDASGRLWVNASGAAVPVTDNSGSLTVDNAGTFAVQAAEADGANVTLGAKADAKSTATDTTAITAMSVLKQISASVQAPPSQAVTNAGTFAVQSTIAAAATNIAKAEDVASADADVGVPAMAIRKATPANTSGTDGDYEMLQVSAGRLWVSDTVTDLIPGVAATNLGKAEDAAHTTGDTGVMMLGVRESTATDLSAGNTNGDYEPLQVDANGALWVSQATLLAGEDLTNNRLNVTQKFSYSHIAAGQATTTVKSGAGFLHSITLNGAATATNVTTVYDNTAGSGTVIAIPAATTATVPTTLTYDVSFATGLTIVTATANGADMTISYY